MEESDDGQLACRCARLRKSVAALQQLKLRPQCKGGSGLVSCALTTDALLAVFLNGISEELKMILATLALVNGFWAICMCWGSWETGLLNRIYGKVRTKKREAYYKFWGQLHASRIEGKKAPPSWWARTRAQFRAQHKLFRVLFHRANVNNDPRKVHTLEQKVTVLLMIVLVKMLVGTLFYQTGSDYDSMCKVDCQFADDMNPAMFEDECIEMGGRPIIEEKPDTSVPTIDTLSKGMLIAVLSMPATVFFDQMFWYAQRTVNTKVSVDNFSEKRRMIMGAPLPLPCPPDFNHPFLSQIRAFLRNQAPRASSPTRTTSCTRCTTGRCTSTPCASRSCASASPPSACCDSRPTAR